jgi:5'-deoxynucleotidase YfbR-like HD superfamily hydrolase
MGPIIIKPLHIMARDIGRQTRFAGGTGKHWWSVLHHSFLVESIICDMTEGKRLPVRDAARLYALLHDLHECYTGDIPTPYKSDEVRDFQKNADHVICARLGIRTPHESYQGFIKIADERALYAEAAVLADRYSGLFEIAKKKALRRDKDHVVCLLHQYGSHTLTTSVYSRGVQDYVEAVSMGVANCKRLARDFSGPTEMLRTAFTDIAPFIPNPNPEVAAA